MSPVWWHLLRDNRLREGHDLLKMSYQVELWGPQGAQLSTPAPLWPSLLRLDPGLLEG